MAVRRDVTAFEGQKIKSYTCQIVFTKRHIASSVSLILPTDLRHKILRCTYASDHM